MSLDRKMSVLSHVVVYAALALFLVLYVAMPFVFPNLTGVERLLLSAVVSGIALLVAIARCSAWANNYRGD